MQIMFGTVLCVLLKSLVLTKATITPKDYITSNILQEESVSMCPKLNFTQDVSMSEKSDHHILNFKSDRSHSDSTARNEREVDEVSLANISIIPESIESNLSKPTSLRAFVQFDSQFVEKVNDIFVTLRWNQPEFTDEIIQGYTVQCSFIDDLKEIQTCDDKNVTTTKLEHTVHNLTSNTRYYFRLLSFRIIIDAAYSIQDNRIYWTFYENLMTFVIDENNITKIASFDHHLHNICIDWVARNLYMTYQDLDDYSYIVKFDLTMWENGIIKFDEILKETVIHYFNVSPSMGILYFLSYNSMNDAEYMMQYDLDGKNEQIVQINASFCLFHYKNSFRDMIIDDMNKEKPLIYWLSESYIIVTDINISMRNTILHKKDISDNIQFNSMTIDKTNIYILARHSFQFTLYVLKKKYASLKSANAAEYVEKLKKSSDLYEYMIYEIYAFDKHLQPYPPMRCLTPVEKVYNFENMNATANSIVVNLPEPVVKSGCKKYNLPTTIYIISVSHCLDNNLNKSEKFNVLEYVTGERYYEIQNLTPFTEYKLKFTLSNFYFDQLSINPFDSNVISIKTNSGKLNAPENISVLALTPTIAVVHWMPPKELNCMIVTYEVHWSVTLVNGTQQKSKQFINVPKRMADGRFFTKINFSLPVQDYLIYVRVYPINFSDFYNESLSKIVHIYSEPNNITLSEVNINSINISWISNINLTIFFTLEYKDIAAEKWQTMNYIKMNYNNEVIYRVENLQSGTLYKFRLILRYVEYEENFIWPADEGFIFSTRGKQMKIPIQHNNVADILKNNFIETLQYCKSIVKLC